MTDVTLIIGDKNTYQTLDDDSGAGLGNPDRVFVPFTGDFIAGDLVWVSDNDSDGELGTIQIIVADDYLDLTEDLTGLYTTAQAARVCRVLNISNYVLDVDTQKNKVTNIGTCEIRLNNPDDILGDTFSTNDTIALAINGSPIFAGKIKDVVPYLTRSGVYTNELKITGIDYGRYGADYYFTEDYESQPGGAIIAKILALPEIDDPWLYTDPPGGTPNVKYEGRRTLLLDAVRDICDEMGYDFYIDHAWRLHIFPVGDEDSGVLLLSVSGDNASNLLSFREFEQDGGDLRNIIEISAGSVKDHYTEENASDWGADGGGAVTDEVDDGAGVDHVIYGKASIKLTCTGAISRAYIDFNGRTLYGYTDSVDLLPFCQSKFLVKGTRTGEDRYSLRPYLVDTAGNKILFSRRKSGSGSKGITEDLLDYTFSTGRWNVVTYPLGDHDGNPVKAAANATNGAWYAEGWVPNPGVLEFDWEHVRRMGFEYPFTENAVIYIDGWTIPSLDAKYTTSGAASIIANDPRMYHEYRRELRSMPQLKAYGDRVLATKKDPLVKFKALARGEVGTIYSAQIVKVRAPQHGIFAETPYIIVRLQHILRKAADTRGFDFWTKYDLVESDADASRVVRSTDPNAAMLAKLRRENRGFKGALDDWDFFVGDAETGTRVGFTVGIAFPTDPADEDIHQLTIDVAVPAVHYGDEGVWYRWNEAGGSWERPPLIMFRAVQPLANGAVLGDEWHDTSGNDLHYECTGTTPDIWTLINYAATTISGTISASQLKKGIQPFDSSVLVETIRAVAALGATFAIDVDGGGVNATITAGAGTFDDFNNGDELLIQHSEDRASDTTARTVQAVNPAGTILTLDNVLAGTDNADDETMIISVTDGLKWTGANPAVWFADGGVQNIANGTTTGLVPDTYWVIFTSPAGGVTLTNTYADAVGNLVGIIARVTIVAGREPFIFPVFTRGGSLTLDFLGAGVIDTIVLTGDALIGKIMKSSDGVDWADGAGAAGTIMTRFGIKGKDGGGVTQFALSSVDGKGYFGAGNAIIDVNGVTIKGQLMRFTSAADNLRGLIYISDPGAGDRMYIYSPNADMTIFNTAGKNITIDSIDDMNINVGAGNLIFGGVGDTTFNNKVTVITNLRIPAGNADPAALVAGDIWLRTDL